VRMLAERLDDPDEGINAVLLGSDLPIDDGDDLPGTVRVYNELDHPFVARRKIQQPEDETVGKVEFPCVVVYMDTLGDPAGVASDSSDGRWIQGVVPIMAVLLMQDADTHLGVRQGMYLLRAMRGVVHRFNNPAALEARTRCGTQLLLATSIQQGNVAAFNEDTVMSPGALRVVYTYLETVPLT
jgi:hypothetical protein